jgi:hypothetical protein
MNLQKAWSLMYKCASPTPVPAQFVQDGLAIILVETNLVAQLSFILQRVLASASRSHASASTAFQCSYRVKIGRRFDRLQGRTKPKYSVPHSAAHGDQSSLRSWWRPMPHPDIHFLPRSCTQARISLTAGSQRSLVSIS